MTNKSLVDFKNRPTEQPNSLGDFENRPTVQPNPLGDFKNRPTERPLPDGWIWTSLEKCAEILDRQRVPINSRERAERIEGKPETELIPYFGATGQVGWIDEHIFDEELVLLGEDGAPFLDAGKDVAYMIRGKSWVNNHAHVLRAANGLTRNSYLLHYLNTFDFHEYVTGTTRLKLNQSRMKEIPVPIAPSPEQERIVAEIEKQFTRLDQAVASLRRLQSNLARYKASVLKAACDGRLVPQDPNDEPAADLLARILAERRAQWQAANPGKKYQEPVGVEGETAVLPELPEGWVWAMADQVCDPIPNGSTPKSHKMYADSGEVPFLKVYNLTHDGSLDFSIKPTFIDEETHVGKLKRSIIYPGDVLMNIVGPPLGKVSIVPNTYPEWNMNQAIVSFRPILPDLNNQFLSYIFLAPNNFNATFVQNIKDNGRAEKS
jgi:type I restriction enzyme S subunit